MLSTAAKRAKAPRAKMASSKIVLRIAADRADIIKSSRDAEAFVKFYYGSAQEEVVAIEAVNRRPLVWHRLIGEINLNKSPFLCSGSHVLL